MKANLKTLKKWVILVVVATIPGLLVALLIVGKNLNMETLDLYIAVSVLVTFLMAPTTLWAVYANNGNIAKRLGIE